MTNAKTCNDCGQPFKDWAGAIPLDGKWFCPKCWHEAILAKFAAERKAKKPKETQDE